MRFISYLGQDPPHLLLTHGRVDISVLRRKNTEFACYPRNSELWITFKTHVGNIFAVDVCT